jgi:hypothetical protein
MLGRSSEHLFGVLTACTTCTEMQAHSYTTATLVARRMQSAFFFFFCTFFSFCSASECSASELVEGCSVVRLPCEQLSVYQRSKPSSGFISVLSGTLEAGGGGVARHTTRNTCPLFTIWLVSKDAMNGRASSVGSKYF